MCEKWKKREITHIQKMLKVHYATFYGPINKQKDWALDKRNSS